METIMSKTDRLDDHRPLADSELDAVAVGTVGEFIDAIATSILGPSLTDKAALAMLNPLGRLGGWKQRTRQVRWWRLPMHGHGPELANTTPEDSPRR
jgi:hypothetical protein